MLKVNTKKISVDDFAVKYHLFPIYGGTNYGTLNKGKSKIMLEDNKYHIWIIANPDWEDCDMEFNIDCDLIDLLFDMIKNGDVIKEEGK